MWTQGISKPYKGLPKGRRFSYKIDDVVAIKENIPDLKIVSPRNQLGGWGGANNVIRGLNTGAYNVYGDYPEVILQEPMDIIDGRFINYNDINDNRKVAVIGQAVYKEMYDKNEPIEDSYIKINGVNFSVIGVYKRKTTGGDNEEGQKQIFVPFTAFSQAFNRGDRVGWMMITANDNVPITSIKEDIFSLMRERHTIHPDDKRAIGHWDVYEEYSKIEGLFSALNIVAFVVGILVLLSGIIGISNIMLIVVKERTKEIGIRRALGATPWSIRGQILLESIFLTIISGMVGIIFGSLTIYGLNAILEANGPVDMFANPSVDLRVILAALAILIISGLLAGFIPAQNAIKVKPVEALRTE
jgi:putative ABC transport system permease protein